MRNWRDWLGIYIPVAVVAYFLIYRDDFYALVHWLEHFF